MFVLAPLGWQRPNSPCEIDLGGSDANHLADPLARYKCELQGKRDLVAQDFGPCVPKQLDLILVQPPFAHRVRNALHAGHDVGVEVAATNAEPDNSSQVGE